MKEKNRETIAQSLYEKKELLDSKKEERARLYSYNKKKADQVQAEVLLLESELEILQKELLEADSNYTPPLPTQKSEKEKLYTIIAPLDRYMASGAAALEKRRFLLFFALSNDILRTNRMFFQNYFFLDQRLNYLTIRTQKKNECSIDLIQKALQNRY